MAELAPQHQAWPLQLDKHLNGIKETFKSLSQELDVTRRERDGYKAQLDAQAKELDDFRKFVGLQTFPGGVKGGFTIEDPNRAGLLTDGEENEEEKKEDEEGVVERESKLALVATEGNPSGEPQDIMTPQKHTRPAGATFENDEQIELTATSPVTPEYYSPLDEVGQSVAHGNQESDLYRSDIPAQANPTITDVFESAGSPLDDSNNEATSEVSKSKGSARNTEFNSGIKKLVIKPVYTLREGTVNSVRFSADGKYLATVCRDGATKIYETETGNTVYVLFDGYLADKYTQTENRVDLESVCFSPDNRFLATAGMDRNIRTWEIGKKGIRSIFKCQGSIGYPNLLDFLPNGRFIISGSADSKVRLWNMRTGTPTIFKGSKKPIWTVRSSPDGRYIAAGTTDMVLIWDTRSRALLSCSLEHPGFVNGVDFTQDGMRLVTGSSKGKLKLWDISSLKLAEQRGLRGQRSGTVDHVQCLRNFDDAGYVWTVALSHDGRWVLSGSTNQGAAYVWDTRNAKRQCVLVPSKSAFSESVAFSPVGDYLAVGTSNHQVLLSTYRMT